eukprot:CAMPEP_0113327064 /NCGR_PEP_ID=MMETSP0010_2-20120614/19008_1 /TAXON_ID=216773 ORGANISM="Corethron hystrix, Strain 308" /NCGR_SAMPLE_ID=MMETSP0010_2 /ASSEMBLY_ACC=CAM_ASM_000155 /LENGTH=120 /DNA_ID=CAMNT_0000187743 /DNA_START=488 /DNA_END=847 /DNA_ORIENTATION=+ /assembly_acc=CAM_ASM_000155
MAREKPMISLIDTQLKTYFYNSTDFDKHSTDHYGQLKLDGNFIIYDGTNKELWRTNSRQSQNAQPLGFPKLKVLDTGIVVVEDSQQNILWKREKGDKIFCDDSKLDLNFEGKDAKNCTVW